MAFEPTNLNRVPAHQDDSLGGDDRRQYFFHRLRAQAETDLAELVRKLWRRKMVIIGAVVTITTLTVITVKQLTPLYEATAEVMINPPANRVIDMEEVLSGLPFNMATIQSEIQVIKSRGLAERVITRLKLFSDPEFNHALRPTPKWQELIDPRTHLPDDWVEILFGDEKVLSEAQARMRDRNAVINNFLDILRVDRVGRSRVIKISFESESPDRAASIANTVADLYIVEQLEAKFEATRRATVWLNDRLTVLRKNVSTSERAVEKFRNSAGLIKGRDSTLASQQITELNTQLVLARSKRAESEARLGQVQNSLKGADGVDSVVQVLASPLIQRLREQEAEVLRKTAELSQEYGDKHPRMINTRAELADIGTKIKAEVYRIIRGLHNDVGVSEAQERSLRASIRELETRIGHLNSAEVQLRALEREASANRALYTNFLRRSKEVSEQEGIQRADARIISSAAVPTEPSFPRVGLLVALAFVGSIFTGVGMVAVIEAMDHGFRSMEQVEQVTGIPSLSLVPLLGKFATPHNYVIDKPTSAFAESLRSLHASLLLSNVDKPPKMILIASAVPEEGKTIIAVSLARVVAGLGRKVILIDGDLRRPEIHKLLGQDLKPGLVDVLAGEATLQESLRKDDASNLLVLPAGSQSTNPVDLFSSQQLKDILAKLAESADLVVIDSPPVLAVSDARTLSRLVDKTVFIVRWAETRREVATMGLKQIMDTGADVAGVVLSMVNVRQHARYGFGDSGYYYGRYRKYYTG